MNHCKCGTRTGCVQGRCSKCRESRQRHQIRLLNDENQRLNDLLKGRDLEPWGREYDHQELEDYLL